MKDTGLVIDSEAAEGREGEPARKARRYDRFRGRVMFPILDSRGNVIGFGGRDHRRGRAQVPQLAGDAALREGARALRPVAGAAGDPRRQPGHRGRGLHGRGGARPARRGERGGDPGHRHDAGARDEAPAARRQRGLLLRRRQRRAQGGLEGAGGVAAGPGRRQVGRLPVPARRRTIRTPSCAGWARRRSSTALAGREAAVAVPAWREIAAKVDMGSEEGRARFLARAKPLVCADRGAGAGRHDPQAPGGDGRAGSRRAARLPAPPGSGARPPSPGRPRGAPARIPSRRRSCSGCCASPTLARTVDPDLVSEGSPEGRALHAVVAFAREGEAGPHPRPADGPLRGLGARGPERPPEAVLTRFRGRPRLERRATGRLAQRRTPKAELEPALRRLTKPMAELAALGEAAAKGVNSRPRNPA